MGLTFIYFCANVLFVYAGQANFWTERRKHLEKNKQESFNSFQVASLPVHTQNLGPSQVLENLNSITIPQLSSSISKSVQDVLPQGSEKKYNHILRSLPYSYGHVRNITLPTGKPNGQTIIHIQDVHMNPEAQENIAKTLQELLDKKVANLVALEGAFGPIDLNRFRSFPDREDIRTAADYMLRVNKISGAIHTALTSAQNTLTFVGIDDNQHYGANVEAYKQSVARMKEYKKLLADLSQDLASQKAQVLNKDLLAFDVKVESYRKEKISLGEYITSAESVIATLPPVIASKAKQSHITLFLQALEMESALDFQEIDKERTALINKLTENLDKKEIAQLLNFSVAYRTGQMRYTDFYQFLQNLCRSNKIALGKFPAMQSYIKYVLISDKINAEKLFKEVNLAEENIYVNLIKTKEENELIDKSKLLILTGKLLDFSLTPEEWKEYKSLSLSPLRSLRSLGLDGNNLNKKSRHREPNELNEPNGLSLSSFEAFYQEANIRDTAMADNFQKAMETHKATIGVLITGGFHSEGLEKHLSEAGAAVITFTPKIKKIDTENGSAYLSVFAQEKTPLEKLFEGDKLFVAPLQFDAETKGINLAALVAALDPRTAADRFKHFFPHSEARIEGEQIGGLRQITLSNAGKKVRFIIKMSGNTIQSVFEKIDEHSFSIIHASSAIARISAAIYLIFVKPLTPAELRGTIKSVFNPKYIPLFVNKHATNINSDVSLAKAMGINVASSKFIQDLRIQGMEFIFKGTWSGVIIGILTYLAIILPSLLAGNLGMEILRTASMWLVIFSISGHYLPHVLHNFIYPYARLALPPRPAPQQAIVNYIKALIDAKDLTEFVDALPDSFEMETKKNNSLYFGMVNGNIAGMRLGGFKPGTKVKIMPVLIDSSDRSKGVYLKLGSGDYAQNYRIKTEPGYFEILDLSLKRTITDYIQAIIEGNDLTKFVDALPDSFEMEVSKGHHLYFGMVNGNIAGMRLRRFKPGTKVKVTPVLIDSSDRSKGVYLKLESGDYAQNYKIKIKPYYFEQVIPDKKEDNDEKTLTEGEINELINEELMGMFEENIAALSGRYSLEIKNIVWGLVGARLAGAYDSRKLTELIDQQIIKVIEESVEPPDTETEFQTLPVLESLDGSQEKTTEPVLFEDAVLSQEDISRMAGKIDRRINERIVDEGLRSLVRNQARNFLRRLEENHFFKIYYRPNPDQYVGIEASKAIEAILLEEQKPLIREVLVELLEEIKTALQLQDELHSAGIRATTHLNLYQLVAVNRILKDKKVILADEMGLGKTLEALSTFLASEASEILVIAPKSALARWIDDIDKHTNVNLELVILTEQEPGIGPLTHPRIQIKQFKQAKDRYEYLLSSRPEPYGKRIMLMNYEVVPNFVKYYHSKTGRSPPAVDFLALDETHMLKNRNTASSRAIFGDEQGKGAIEADYKILITGTPLENKAQELLGYLKYLARGGSTIAEQFFNALDLRRFSTIFSHANIASLSQLHGYLASRMFRRLKSDVVTGLPAKQFIKVRLNPIDGTMTVNGENTATLNGDYSRQLDLYETALQNPKEFEQTIARQTPELTGLEEDKEEEEFTERSTQLLRLEQTAIDPQIFGPVGDSIKYDAALQIIAERRRQGKSILIFTSYRTAANRFKNMLEQVYVPGAVAYVDGTIVDKPGNPARSKEIERFQNKEAPIMVATTGTMGVAVELTQADTLIFLNYPWKPSSLNQAIDRAHRLDPVRNHPGRILEIVSLELDLPVSIDRLKAVVLKRKSILTEMLVEGNLTPEILDAFIYSDVKLIQTIKGKSDGPITPDEYELTALQRLRLLIGRIFRENAPARRSELWDEAAHIYYRIVERKSSFFANMASLDYLSGEKFPELKGRKLETLDLGSGPSTLYRAYERKRSDFENRGLNLNITDYDLSPHMLSLGAQRPVKQVLGSFENLSKAFAEESFDIVNISFAFRYATRPAQLIRDVHKILKDKGTLVIILPKTNFIPGRFIEALEKAGFDLRVGQNARLVTQLDKDIYSALFREYGKEFADDIAQEVRSEFVFVVANKNKKIQAEIADDDFRLQRLIRQFNRKKVERMTGSRSRHRFFPEHVTVEGRVIYLPDLFPQELPKPVTELRNVEYNHILKLINDIQLLVDKYAVHHRKSVKTSEGRKKIQLEKKIVRKFEVLHKEIKNSLNNLDSAERELLIEELESFPEQNKGWFSAYDSTIQAIIDELNNPFNPDNPASSLDIKDTGGIIFSIRYLIWGVVWNLGRLERRIFDSELVSAKWRDAGFTTRLRNYFSPENYDESHTSYNKIYDRWVGFLPETLLVVLAIAILNHYGINLKLSNVIAWSGFFLYHVLEYSFLRFTTSKSAPGFLKSKKLPRSPPINIFFAGLISVISISLGFLPVSHNFIKWIVYLVPFQTHFNTNFAASVIFNNTLKSVRPTAKRTKIQVSDIAISNLEIPIEKHYRIPKFSLSRSLKQRFNGWMYNEVLETPLTLTDHILLAILAALLISPSLLFAIPTIYSESISLLLLSLPSIPLFFIVTIALMAPHIKEQSDAFSVFRNYLKYRRNPETNNIDTELLKLVNKFEASINLGEDENNKWKISFTDNPYLLAQTDVGAKKIILNIGWIISSSRQKDRRRLAYLTAVLRNIRKAIGLRRYTDKSALELGTIHHKSIETEKGDTNIPNGRPLSYEVTSSHAETLYKASFTARWRRYTFEISAHKDYPQSTAYSAYITDYEMKRDMIIEEMRIFEERLFDAIKSSDNETLRFLYSAVLTFIDKRTQASDSHRSGPNISSTKQQARKDAHLMTSILNPPHPPLSHGERGLKRTTLALRERDRGEGEMTTLAEMLDAVMPRQEKLNVGELDSRPLRFINNLSDNLHAGDYRHEFLKALSRELESVGLKEMTETQVMESVLNFIGYQNTLPAKEAVVAQIKESRELNKIPVINAVVRRADLPALREIVEAQREDNAINSNHPSKLLIAPAEAGLEADLKVIASGPDITVMKKADVLHKDIVVIDLLDSLFNAWAKQNNIPVQSVSLILAIPKGFHPNPEAISNLPKDSPFRDAFLIIMDALTAMPVKITDFNRITEVAIFIAQQA